MSKKKVVVLGSTGSIGKQCLEVIEKLQSRFSVIGLSAERNAELLTEQAKKFGAKFICIGEKEKISLIKKNLGIPNNRILWGEDGLVTLAGLSEADIVVNGLVGFAGLLPTLEACKKGKRIALANKETLVSGGEIVSKIVKENGAEIIPVDSEHSAIFQCLNGEKEKAVNKILLTSSGGPFRKLSRKKFRFVKVSHALTHPTWKMGRKITVDSATLMNKGLEVIEAHWLFSLPPEKIEVVIHPQSIVHSLVEFIDGSVIAQLSLPDMRLPIQYALSYPDRYDGFISRLNLTTVSRLDFYHPDFRKFPCLELSYEALKIGGTMPAVLNAANEIAIKNFLLEKIPFIKIPKIIEKTMRSHKSISHPNLKEIRDADIWAREKAESESFI